MAERTERPKIKEQNPIITYRQDNFANGMYHDRALPASQIPDGSVRWAKDMLLFPDRAEVRPGTELWSDLPQPALAGRDDYQASKSGYIITKTAGDNFTAQDVDSYFVWPESGHRDLILEYIGPTQVRVKFDTAEAAATTANPGHLEGPKNARNFWHEGSQRLFGFFDNRVFFTNYLMTDPWTEVQYHGPISPAIRPISQWSTFDALRDFIYLINPNGVFVIDTGCDPLEMWKANLDVPTNSVTEVAKAPGLEFGRRYTHTFTRLAGQGYRNRNEGAQIQQETGNCELDADKADQDYAVVYGPDPSVGYRSLGPFTVPVADRQWTHIALYSSQDIEDPETMPEKFILNNEVPIGKAFDACRDINGIISIVPGGQGEFEPEDVGCPIVFEDGTVDTIGAYISPTEVSGFAFGVVLGQAAAIGKGRILRASQVGTTITRAGGAVFVPADVGRRIYWADGYWSFMVEYVDANHMIAESSSNHVGQAATIDPYERYICDLVPDSVLEGRKENQLFILSHRNWVPLPILKAGVVVPGFLIAANAEKNEILQSAMGQNKEYLAGYYHPYYQVLPTKDNVVLLREFPGRVVVYCSTSTRYALTNSVRAVQTDAGDYIPVLSGLALADQAIGIKDVSAVYEIPDGRDFVLTSEPAPRFFNGQQYSENLAIDAYGRGYCMEMIRSLQAAVAMGYDEAKLGLILYGSDEAAET